MHSLAVSVLFAGLFTVGVVVPSASAAQTIGTSTLVVKTVTGTHSEGSRQIQLQDDIYHNEIIETFDESATEVTFLDGTTITMGPNSKITLDRFVYDPNQSNSSFVMTVIRGALRFSSGDFPSEAYVIHTPVATIGIKGTIIELVVTPTNAADGSATANVNITVVEGEAEIINCERKRTKVPTGLSSSVFGLEEGGCSDATIPGPPPDDITKIFERGDDIILSNINNLPDPNNRPFIPVTSAPGDDILDVDGPTTENPNQVVDDTGTDPDDEATPNALQ